MLPPDSGVMTDPTDQEAELVGLIVECILYGIFLVSAGWCLWIWLNPEQPRAKRALPRILGAATILLVVLATLDVVLSSRMAIQGYVESVDVGGPEVVYANISSGIYVTRVAIGFICVLVIDAVLIYRCYVVCYHWWPIIVLPCLLWLAEAACIGVIVFYFATTEEDLSGGRLLSTKSFYIATASMNFVLTIWATGFITYRILSVSRGTEGMRISSGKRDTLLQRVYRILIEAAIPYVIICAVLLIVTLKGSNVGTIISDADMMVFGINFNLITIRVHRQPRCEDSTPTITTLRFTSSRTRQETATRFSQAHSRAEKGDSLTTLAMSDLSAKDAKGSSSHVSSVDGKEDIV